MTYRPESKEAYESIKPFGDTITDAILGFIKAKGPSTCDEIEVALNLRHQTASAIISVYRADGTLTQVGQRPTRSGRNAAVLALF